MAARLPWRQGCALADGSDIGGSLRSPAAWCNVVGFRPTPGRVPVLGTALAFEEFSVHGPMARTVADAALLLSAIAGPDRRSPVSLAEPGSHFARSLERDWQGVRIAWSSDLGLASVSPDMVAVLDPARQVLETIGCSVEQDLPGIAGASETRSTLCCVVMLSRFGEVLDTRPDQLDWRIKRIAGEARKLSAEQVLRAEEHRGELWRRMCAFFERYDYLAWPVNACNPYPADDMHAIDKHDWLMQDIQPLLGLPCISLPCGFASDGSPVGLQITGRRGDDLGVLQLAQAYECETGFWRRRPPGM